MAVNTLVAAPSSSEFLADLAIQRECVGGILGSAKANQRQIPVEVLGLEDAETILLPHKTVTDFIKANTGIVLNTDMEKRLKKLQSNRPIIYLGLLKKIKARDLNATRELLDHVTVNETSFFRVDSPIKHCETFLPEIIRKKIENQNFNLNIISAGGSNGSEAYTLAILASESLKKQGGNYPWKIQVVVIDINSKRLEEACNGVYKSYDLRNVPPEILQNKNYFEKIDEENYRISSELRSRIKFEFREGDLRTIEGLPLSDIAFCSNVLIYLREKSDREQIVGRLLDSLAPENGTLFIDGRISGLNDLAAVEQKATAVPGKINTYRRKNASKEKVVVNSATPEVSSIKISARTKPDFFSKIFEREEINRARIRRHVAAAVA